jgi:hypothetical protein
LKRFNITKGELKMIYGTRIYKNGRRRSYLTFDSGKIVVLKHNDAIDFANKMNHIEYGGKLKGLHEALNNKTR